MLFILHVRGARAGSNPIRQLFDNYSTTYSTTYSTMEIFYSTTVSLNLKEYIRFL